MSVKYSCIVCAASLLLISCAQEQGPEAQAPQATPASAAPTPAAQPKPAAQPSAPAMPASIVAERGGFIPEGVEYDQANRRFLTGSLAEGSIFHINSDGRLTALVSDPALVSSVGIEVDEPRDRILVANSDSSVFQGRTQGLAQLGIYSLTTGARLAMVDLAATIQRPGDDAVFFANDVTVAQDGTVFVTDTRMNVVYQVDTDYRASVLHRFESTEGIALNGLVHHPDGYLLVASLGNGSIYKVPVDDPAATSQVTLAEPVAGADGVVWTADGRLAVVSNSDNRVVALRSSDDWSSAQIAGVATYDGQATTAAAVGDDIYVVKPHFADQDPPSIERVTFQ